MAQRIRARARSGQHDMSELHTGAVEAVTSSRPKPDMLPKEEAAQQGTEG